MGNADGTTNDNSLVHSNESDAAGTFDRLRGSREHQQCQHVQGLIRLHHALPDEFAGSNQSINLNARCPCTTSTASSGVQAPQLVTQALLTTRHGGHVAGGSTAPCGTDRKGSTPGTTWIGHRVRACAQTNMRRGGTDTTLTKHTGVTHACPGSKNSAILSPGRDL